MSNEDKKELAYEDYLSGMKYKDIALKHEVSVSAVKSWATRYWKSDNRKVATKNKKSCNLQPKKVATRNIIIDDNEDNELSEKQQLFCQLYVRSFNATQSYLKAYGGKYSTANVEGFKLLAKPSIKSEITRLKEIKAQRVLATADDVVEMHMRIAFADITDYVDFKAEDQPVMAMYGPVMVKDEETGEKQMLTQRVNKLLFKNSNLIDGQLISEVSDGKNGTKIKLESRQKSLDFLERFFELNPMNVHKKDYDNKRLAIEEANNKNEANDSDAVVIFEGEDDI